MISVVLITHNYGKYIQNSLDSILNNNQSIIGEIIIVNDSSEDNTEELIKKYLTNPKIKYFFVKFKSLSKSYNFGVNKSIYSLITKVDADDMLESNFIDNYYNELNLKNYDLIFGNLKILDEKMNLLRLKNQSKELIGSKFKYPVGSGTIYKKSIWQKIGGFDEKLKYQDDYDFWLKINKIKDIKIGSINKSGYKYRMHGQNMSKSILKKNLSKIYVFLKNYI
jgi:glycosyltransferase involved in cell wall biosynthesis